MQYVWLFICIWCVWLVLCGECVLLFFFVLGVYDLFWMLSMYDWFFFELDICEYMSLYDQSRPIIINLLQLTMHWSTSKHQRLIVCEDFVITSRQIAQLYRPNFHGAPADQSGASMPWSNLEDDGWFIRPGLWFSS